MDNIWLGRYPIKGAMVDEKEMYNENKGAAGRSGDQRDPRVLVRQLSVSSVQTIEIAKAISYNAKIIIMDEPTSSLTDNEVEHLFKLIRPYAGQGRGHYLYLIKWRRFSPSPTR